MINWCEMCSNCIHRIATSSIKSIYHANVPWSPEIRVIGIFLSTKWSVCPNVTSERERYNNGDSINFSIVSRHHANVFIQVVQLDLQISIEQVFTPEIEKKKNKSKRRDRKGVQSATTVSSFDPTLAPCLIPSSMTPSFS